MASITTRTSGVGHGSEAEECFLLSYEGGAILVIAPLSANFIAKITAGLIDNLLQSVVRARDTTGEIDASIANDLRKLIVVAAMWKHPITKKQIKVLEKDWGVNGDPEGWAEVLEPIQKTLACGDVGDSAMHDWRDIVDVIETWLRLDVGSDIDPRELVQPNA